MPNMSNLQVFNNHSLESLNSFGFAVNADYFVAVSDLEALRNVLSFTKEKKLPLVVLGEGSNVVLRKDLEAVVLKMAIQGIERVDEDEASVSLKVGAGENWHAFVLWCLENGYYGLENLSLIPGTVGAAPIQNIGAYGVEQCECFVSLSAVNRDTGELKTFSSEECQFAYRESVFKGKYRDEFIITHVTYRVSKHASTRTRYGAIETELLAMDADFNDPVAVSNAVCNIRRSKLPDPNLLGNAGSFFKNPIIPTKTFGQLQSRYPEIVGFPDKKGHVKVAAGWLIEHSGWKGFREGEVGVHVDQALVLINYGDGSGEELLSLARRIQRSIKEKFGTDLESEPRIYPAL